MIACVWYISGLLIFHTYAIAYIVLWDWAYYTWAKISDVLFILALHNLLPEHRNKIKFILIYSIVRACFQIADIFVKIGSNHPITVNTLFLVALIVLIALTIQQLKNEWKD